MALAALWVAVTAWRFLAAVADDMLIQTTTTPGHAETLAHLRRHQRAGVDAVGVTSDSTPRHHRMSSFYSRIFSAGFASTVMNSSSPAACRDRKASRLSSAPPAS